MRTPETTLLFTALLAVPALTSPALAFDESDRTGLLARADAYETAVTGKDYDAFVAALPPKLVQVMAERNGMDAATLIDALRVQVNAAMASVQTDRFDLETDRMTTGDTATGRPYALIPTLTLIAQQQADAPAGNAPAKQGAEPQSVRSVTLALKDGANWYLVRLEGAEAAQAVRDAYPDFAAVALDAPAAQ